MNEYENLLTLNDVVKIFNVTRPTVYKWEKDDILHPIKIGNVRRYKEKEIQELLKKGEE